MFERVSSSLQKIFRDLRGYGRLSERNIQEALRDVRLALLEADVNYRVVRDFIARVKEKCLGRDVLESITPGQQVVKHVHDAMVELLGGAQSEPDLSAKPAAVMLLGLHGSGKTTTAAKLALRWKKAGRRVLLAGCDPRRPAAADQLRILARQVGVEMEGPRAGESVPRLGARALERARREELDVVVLDTGGRFQVDADLVAELRELRDAVQPRNVLLVLDAAIGQESVNVAQTFHRAVGLTGVVLTKLDGDARGGAALSVRAVTGCPVVLAGTGERLEDLEPFYPDRMASRILGMGDVVSLVEKAQEAVDEEEMARMEEKLADETFSLEDFLTQLRGLRKMGPMQDLLQLMPGAGGMPGLEKAGVGELSEEQLRKTEAIIQSMTIQERRRPDVMNASRRRRVAAGSGTQVQDVNDLLRNFDRAKKMVRGLKKAQKRLLRAGK